MHIREAICAIRKHDYDKAYEEIKDALMENQDSAEVHNLLGIIAELNRDLCLAGRHYRAAYALDPTYSASRINLDRISSSFYKPVTAVPDYGDKPDAEIQRSRYQDRHQARHMGFK
jgi:hypothetical protein